MYFYDSFVYRSRYRYEIFVTEKEEGYVYRLLLTGRKV